MATPFKFTNDMRRSRLVKRHNLDRSANNVTEAINNNVVFHSSDPCTPILSAYARVEHFQYEQFNDALLNTREIVRIHAMRRTLFMVLTAQLPIFFGGASHAVALSERRKLEKWLHAELPNAPQWLDALENKVIEFLESSPDDHRTQDISAAIPEMRTEITLGSGKWTTRSPVSSRILFLLAMEGRIMRTRPTGSWRSSQYHWTSSKSWIGHQNRFHLPTNPESLHNARAQLLTRYLTAFGPATINDIKWWTGWTMAQTKKALHSIETYVVALDGGDEGYLLADDTHTYPLAETTISFLPALDGTPMGWKQRDWYLGEYGSLIFDRNGNIGPTIWVDGHIIGGWAQLAEGNIVYQLFKDVGTQNHHLIDAYAAQFSEWLQPHVVIPRFRTPLERELAEK